jgi:hypothetical protein
MNIREFRRAFKSGWGQPCQGVEITRYCALWSQVYNCEYIPRRYTNACVRWIASRPSRRCDYGAAFGNRRHEEPPNGALGSIARNFSPDRALTRLTRCALTHAAIGRGTEYRGSRTTRALTVAPGVADSARVEDFPIHLAQMARCWCARWRSASAVPTAKSFPGITAGRRRASRGW